MYVMGTEAGPELSIPPRPPERDPVCGRRGSARLLLDVTM